MKKKIRENEREREMRELLISMSTVIFYSDMIFGMLRVFTVGQNSR